MSNSIKSLTGKSGRFGTAPVFFTAISTILGAILFLRFGYAVGNVGFIGTILIIIIGHIVTLPTAMAIAEIATNQKVEGGGIYYIISRSFGINIGAAIGLALYFSQAISVAFYVIAFAEAFDPVMAIVNDKFGWSLADNRIVSVPALILVSILMMTKGASIGMKTLYVVVSILFITLVFFFIGNTGYGSTLSTFPVFDTVEYPDGFFIVFAIVFPAFTGMAAGVGLSGDLRNPKKSIPIGTMAATIGGMLIYGIVAYKLALSASPEDLNAKQFIMSDIAIWAPIIPIGLAAGTISSALGSIMVAPRTLQALAVDKVFPSNTTNQVLGSGRGKDNEPVFATLATSILAMFFVVIGSVDFVATIISMFFMVTYGSLCLLSFLNHLTADPAYRPAFRSRLYSSLLGLLTWIYLMFNMNPVYSVLAIVIMTVIYIGISNSRKDDEGIAKLFQGVIFQISRTLQIFLQKSKKSDDNWRPSIISISEAFFTRPSAFNFLRWIARKHGFGTYIHYTRGYFSKETNENADHDLKRILEIVGKVRNNVFIDTMISPSYTTAIAQAIQLPSYSGKEFNMFLFEYSKEKPDDLPMIIDNFMLVKAANFDICILASSEREFGFNKSIHIWLTARSHKANGTLMILMGYIISDHMEWKNAEIKIFTIIPKGEIEKERSEMISLIREGRLPISERNVIVFERDETLSSSEIVYRE